MLTAILESLRLIREREGGIAHVLITVNKIFEEFQKKGLPYDKVQLRTKMAQLCSDGLGLKESYRNAPLDQLRHGFGGVHSECEIRYGSDMYDFIMN